MNDDGSFGFGGPEPGDLREAPGKTAHDSKISKDSTVSKELKASNTNMSTDSKNSRRSKRTMADLERELGITPMAKTPAASK